MVNPQTLKKKTVKMTRRQDDKSAYTEEEKSEDVEETAPAPAPASGPAPGPVKLTSEWVLAPTISALGTLVLSNLYHSFLLIHVNFEAPS